MVFYIPSKRHLTDFSTICEKMLTKTTLYKKELMNAICDDDVFSHFFACLPASNDECFVSSLLHHILQTTQFLSFLIFMMSSLCEICSKNRRILCFNFFPLLNNLLQHLVCFSLSSSQGLNKKPFSLFNDEISTTFFRFFVV